AGGAAAPLLQRRQRGRADHDHGADRERRDGRADRRPAVGARGARRCRRGRPRARARLMAGPLILSIETSCDETGIALIEGGRTIHSNIVASQVALHAGSGGIVPEVAARAHLRWIVPALDAAWSEAGVGWSDIDAVAVTYGPGLAGSLLVGINFAKALAW